MPKRNSDLNGHRMSHYANHHVHKLNSHTPDNKQLRNLERKALQDLERAKAGIQIPQQQPMPLDNQAQNQQMPLHHARPILHSEFALIIVLLILGGTRLAYANDCLVPKGSYLNSCLPPKGEVYKSTDSNLASISMCKFTFDCATIFGSRKKTEIYVQKSMVACMKFFENCGGQPVVRGSEARFCIKPSTILLESQRTLEL